MAHKFGMAFGAIELPRVEAFLTEYEDLCEKFGLQFAMAGDAYDGSQYALLQDINTGTADADYFGLFYVALDHDIPEIAAHTEAESQKRREERARREEEALEKAVEANLKKEEILRATGITLSDGVYKLVKVVEPASEKYSWEQGGPYDPW